MTEKFFDGNITNIHKWNRALSTDEITTWTPADCDCDLCTKKIRPNEIEWPPCIKCGRLASHVQFSSQPQLPNRFLCCNCYIEEGMPPADWHPDCIKAFDRRSKQ